SPAAAAAAARRRGWQIFGFAFLFRLQSYVLGGGAPLDTLLKVDILNIMGPSIVLAALLWRAAGSLGWRCAVFAAATAITAFATPQVRGARLDWLPDFIEAYVVPVAGLSNFVFFPWMALVFAGAFVGVLIDAVASPAVERRLNVRLALGAAAVIVVTYAASHLPALVSESYFWTSSPSYLFIRAGFVTLGIAVAYAWTTAFEHRSRAVGSRPVAAAGGEPRTASPRTAIVTGRWSPLATLGRTSLFVYWIHVELVYGLVSRPLHHSLTLLQAWIAYVLFTTAMLGCALMKERIADRFQAQRRRVAAAA
ncbi:MAG: hypothetical protein ACREUZ_14920, partial [Burkholderiales bacterium]